MRRTAEDAAVTRTALEDAALAVVARKGYAATRLEDVAAHAHVTRGALYHHFGSKAELFAAAVAARWGELAGQVFAALDGEEPPLERVERFVAGYARRIASDPRFRQLLEVVVLRVEPHPDLDAGLVDKQQATAAWVDALIPTLGQARDAGQLRAGLDARGAAADVVTVLYGITVEAAVAAAAPAGGPGSVPDAERLARTVVRGLAR